jgi:hypothetical protein
VGGGLAQVGLLLAAIVIGLPCFFFTLLALLDHFEQRLTAGAPTAAGAGVRPAQVVVQVAPAVQIVDSELETDSDVETDSELIGATVVELPPPFNASSAPAAATG